jgi:hypothetical protein
MVEGIHASRRALTKASASCDFLAGIVGNRPLCEGERKVSIMMTKEAVRGLWDSVCDQICEKNEITEPKWDQNVCGAITATTMLKIQKADPKDLAAMQECCAYGSNSSARKQAKFSEKKTKATALAANLMASVQ